MEKNGKKIKTIVVTKETVMLQIISSFLKQVKQFKYLGS